MNCWRCGAFIEISGARRVSRTEECPTCRGDLHCCKNCRFHDPQYHNECREAQAERVTDRERANFCDYFLPMRT